MEIQSMATFLPYLDRVRWRTDRVVERIPDERMEWRPGQGRFSFGGLLRHLAGVERWTFAENAAGRPSRYPGHGRELADGPAAVRAYYGRLRNESLDIYRRLSDADLARPCTTPAGADLPTWKWLRAMVEHEVHHRGQLYLMLSLVGVAAPPMFGLTAEEVLERSQPGTPSGAPGMRSQRSRTVPELDTGTRVASIQRSPDDMESEPSIR